MTNIALPRLDMYKDVATFNIARIASKLLPKKSVLKLIQRAARENARTPVQWSDAEKRRLQHCRAVVQREPEL